MKKILITGGLGNLGSWLTAHFAKNWDVYVLAKNKRPILEDQAFTYIPCDITNFEECKSVFDSHQFEYIIHTASVNDGFVDNYYKLAIEVNTLGTRNILEAIKNHKVKHLIYMSTFQVYGKYTGKITEDTPLEPKNDYGNTHLFSEFYLKQFEKQVPYSAIRLTNSYGCPLDHDSSKWYLILNDLSRSAVLNREIVLKSNGLAPRDFIWMGDVCDIFERLIQSPPKNEVYNLAGERTFTMLEIANYVKQAYYETYGEEIPVRVNTEDTTAYPEPLQVSAQKLKAIVPFDAQPHFVEEAKKIFKLAAAKI
ncbi:MAG TPA: NAD(P)-dependent oxidoreductase [Cytophagales bacterium]|nr:NAD(P)-dependent oxidoreductase [Cytophagales bacterium]